MSERLARILSGLAVAIAIVVCQENMALAVTTGSIDGYVTDANTKNPIANAQVRAVSPSGGAPAATDAKGHYVIQGLVPDTYAVIVTKAGYETRTVPGITVIQGSSATINVEIAAQLKTLGSVLVRSAASLVQPNTPIDSYSVGTKQLDQLGGITLNDNEATLIEEIPSISSTGGGGSPSGLQGYYPLIRGGLENNEGFQLEGIVGTEPLSNQFINNLILNGASRVNVVAGAGDATQGGAGSGYVNIVSKVGTYPAGGQIQFDTGFPAFEHNFKVEYGGATPDGRLSYFYSGRYDRNFGGCCSPPFANTWGTANTAQIDTIGQLQNVNTNDTLVNVLYRFGKDQKNTLQFWNDIGSNQFYGSYGVDEHKRHYATGDPFMQSFYTGFPPAQIPLYPTQPSPNATIDNPDFQTGDFTLTKLGFNSRINDTTFLSARVYRTQNTVVFGAPDLYTPYLGYGYSGLFSDFYEFQHTQNTGVGAELQKQLGEHHDVTIGGEYRFSKVFQTAALPSLSFFFEQPSLFTASDYSPGGQFGPGSVAGGPNGLRIPTFTFFVTRDPGYFYNVFITDQWKPNSRLTVSPGIRDENQRMHTPGGTYNTNAISPKLNAAYVANAAGTTVLRASYGHSTIFAPLGQIEADYEPPAFYHQYPATLSICGAPAYTGTCKDYFDQLYNEWYASFGANPYAFPKAQKSDTIDFSFEHEFPHNITLKITPYHRHDYDVIVNESQLILLNGTYVNGPQTVTNDGRGETTGVEFALSRQVSQGLSGQLNLTYINQFINYLSSAGFEPTVQPAILQTNTLAHPAYLSPLQGTLTLDYRRNGWRVNPIFIYSHGYPVGIWETVNAQLAGNPGPFTPIPRTNVFGGPLGNATSFCYYADPQVPGTPQNPNIVGATGGGCTKALNGALTHSVLNVNLAVSRELSSHTTVGIDVQNLFNNVANYPYNSQGGLLSYVNNGFGAYGPGSGDNPNSFVPGAPKKFPPTPFFTLPSGPGIQSTVYVNFKL